jgi:hypothetical protein
MCTLNPTYLLLFQVSNFSTNGKSNATVMRSPKRMTVHRGTKIERDSSSQSQSRSFHGNTGAKIEEIDRNAIDAWKCQILFLAHDDN